MLLDVQMPGMDGFETAELIKGRERTRHVPIIFVTAISKERHHVFRGYSAGAVDYVFKPYDPGVLRSKVAVFLELDAKTRAAAQSEAILRAAFDEAPIGMARLDLDGPRGRGQPGARRPARPSRRGPARPAGRVARRARGRGRGRSCRAGAARAGRPGHGGARAAPARPGRRGRPVRAQLVAARTAPAAGGRGRRAGAGPARAPAGGGRAGAAVREQAARREAERASERLRAVQRISDAALAARTFDALVRELLLRIGEVVAADTAAVVLPRDDDAAIVTESTAACELLRPAGRRRRGPRHAARPRRPRPASTRSARRVRLDAGDAPLVVDGAGDRRAARRRCCSPARFTEDSEDAAARARRRPRGDRHRARAAATSASTRIAEELQRSLLPGRAAAAARARDRRPLPRPAAPAPQVGGDWYDAVLAAGRPAAARHRRRRRARDRGRRRRWASCAARCAPTRCSTGTRRRRCSSA